MNVLMVQPRHPVTFWSFKYALKYVSKKTAFLPLGLLTVAALLPRDWQVRLVDLNCGKLREKDLQWADYVMIGAMLAQKPSVAEIIKRCRQAGNPKYYYRRICRFLQHYRPRRPRRITARRAVAFIRSIFYPGIPGNGVTQMYYWRLLIKLLIFYRNSFNEAMTLMAYGEHFRKVAKKVCSGKGAGAARDVMTSAGETVMLSLAAGTSPGPDKTR